MHVLATAANMSFKSIETIDKAIIAERLTMVVEEDNSVFVTIEHNYGAVNTLLFTFGSGEYSNLRYDTYCHRVEIVDSLLKAVYAHLGWVGVPTYEGDPEHYNPLGVFKDVYVVDGQLLLDWGVVTRKKKAIIPTMIIKETIDISASRGEALGGESIHVEKFYSSGSSLPQKASVVMSVYREAFFTVCAPKISYYQPVRVLGLVFADLPIIVYDTTFTKRLYDSYSMQKVVMTSKSSHMALVDRYDAYVFIASKSTKFYAEKNLRLYNITAPEWARLPMNSDGCLKHTYLYALSYDRELSDNDLAKLGCVLAREIWAESGKMITDEVVYPETVVYNNGVPVKSDYEHLFVTPTSGECRLNAMIGSPQVMSYTCSIGTVIDKNGKNYVSVRKFEYNVNITPYVSCSRLNSLMDMPRDERLTMLEKLPDGSYSYEGVDYDEFYISFPETKYALKFIVEYGAPSFADMYANMYDNLPDDLKSLETSSSIEEVCEYYYMTIPDDNE